MQLQPINQQVVAVVWLQPFLNHPYSCDNCKAGIIVGEDKIIKPLNNKYCKILQVSKKVN